MLGVILDSEESQQLPGQQAAPPNPVPQPRCVGGEWTGPGSGGSWERQPASRLRYLRPLNSKPRRRRNVLRVNKDPEVGGRGTEIYLSIVPDCTVQSMLTFQDIDSSANIMRTRPPRSSIVTISEDKVDKIRSIDHSPRPVSDYLVKRLRRTDFIKRIH
uniref:Uncharacterized protein n=1 Tax=Coccidioides posadasii RMSCC 3488 TaxID=454284 RepID=A0A0J6FJ98_COCPO|nr:hypothetical protein CPAG_05796 [Coccidioides posadasii RMSCC 3488]